MNIEKFNKYRYFFLVACQSLSCLICIYFIYNVQKYQVSLGKWSWIDILIPGVLNKINSFFQTVGTYILLLPLTILLLSLCIPESFMLRIAGSFFGIMGSLWFIITCLFSRTIGDMYNMGLFIVNKILTLEEKRVIFKGEFMRMVNDSYKTTTELYLYLQEKLSDINY